jgi:hypothetical protein
LRSSQSSQMRHLKSSQRFPQQEWKWGSKRRNHHGPVDTRQTITVAAEGRGHGAASTVRRSSYGSCYGWKRKRTKRKRRRKQRGVRRGSERLLLLRPGWAGMVSLEWLPICRRQRGITGSRYTGSMIMIFIRRVLKHVRVSGGHQGHTRVPQ